MDKKNILEEAIKNILGFIDINPVIQVEQQDESVYQVNIIGDNLNFLIGYRGQSLDALQSFLGLIMFRQTGERTTVVVDINDYKDQRTERIREIARKFIDKARFFQGDVELPPMNPWERRQIHMMIQDYDDIISESTGEGRDRRVVLKPNK